MGPQHLSPDLPFIFICIICTHPDLICWLSESCVCIFSLELLSFKLFCLSSVIKENLLKTLFDIMFVHTTHKSTSITIHCCVSGDKFQFPLIDCLFRSQVKWGVEWARWHYHNNTSIINHNCWPSRNLKYWWLNVGWKYVKIFIFHF